MFRLSELRSGQCTFSTRSEGGTVLREFSLSLRTRYCLFSFRSEVRTVLREFSISLRTRYCTFDIRCCHSTRNRQCKESAAVQWLSHGAILRQDDEQGSPRWTGGILFFVLGYNETWCLGRTTSMRATRRFVLVETRSAHTLEPTALAISNVLETGSNQQYSSRLATVAIASTERFGCVGNHDNV